MTKARWAKESLQRLQLCLCASLLVLSPAYAQSEYTAATGRVEITPKASVYMAGYQTDRRSTGTLDPLYAKLLFFNDGRQQIAMVTIDSIGLTFPDIEVMRKRVYDRWPTTHLIVGSTHSHATPDVVGLWGPSRWQTGRENNHVSDIAKAVEQMIERAQHEQQPVKVRSAHINKPLAWVVNRSEPDLLDAHMSVLQVTTLSGETLATLTNYPCHPTVLDGGNTLLSADYLSGFYQTMQSHMSGEHLFYQGAIGGWVQPISGASSAERATALGTELANASLALLKEATEQDSPPLSYGDKLVSVPVENWGFRLMMWLDVLQRDITEGRMTTRVSVFEIADNLFITHPGETSPAYSIACRALTPAKNVFVLGLTQDAMGYILKPDYFANENKYPHAAYLTSVSAGSETGPILMQAITELVKHLQPIHTRPAFERSTE